MKDGFIPIGSVVETKNGKRYIVLGYYREDAIFSGDMIAPFATDELYASAYPFDLTVSFYWPKYKKQLEKFNYDPFEKLYLKDITKILFEGYKDESYYDMVEKFTKK